MLLGFIALYVLFQLGVGAAVSRRIRSEEDYFVAGRRLGPALATASMFATWFGAEACVGAAGEVYARGWYAVSGDPFGYGLALLLFGALVARPLWNARITTIADLYRNRFSQGVERVVALLMIPGSILWAAAQIRAFGAVVASTTDLLDLQTGLLVAAAVTVAYTSLGGLLADAWTDLIQGSVLLVGVAVLAGVALAAPGSAEALSAEITRSDPGLPPSLAEQVDAWAIPILGSLFAQELAARAAGARTGRLAQTASFGAGGLYLVAGLFPVGLGLLARAQLPDLDAAESALPAMAELHLGVLGKGILAGAMVSAILSTIDSALLAASGLLTHNLWPKGDSPSSEKGKLRTARLGVVGLGGIAWFLAGRAESVHSLVEEASAFGSSGFVVTGLGMLFTRCGGPRTAYATLGAGALGYVISAHVIQTSAPFSTSLACAGLAWLAGVAIERCASR